MNFTCLVPHADHWMMAAEPYFKWQDGTSSFWSAVYAQVNDSRYVVSTLLEFLIIRFTHWNLRFESVLCVLLALGSAACVIFLFRRLQGGWVAWLSAVLGCCLILSPQQWMNWTFGVQICYAAVVLGTVAVAVVFQTTWPLVLRSSAGAVCAIIAAHSFINGWFAWVIGLVFLSREAWTGIHRRRETLLAFFIWLVPFAGTALVYFSGYGAGPQPPGGTSLAGRLLAEPQKFLSFFWSVLGAPFSDGWASWDRDSRIQLTHAIGPVVGVISLILFVVALFTIAKRGWSVNGKKIFPFIVLALWGLANAGAIALGRTGIVMSDPFQSRYLAYVGWFHIGLLAILSVAEGKVWKWVRAIWLSFVAYGCVIGFIQGMRGGERDYRQNRIMTASVMLRHVAPEPVYLDAVRPGSGAQLLQGLDRLQRMGCLHVSTLPSERVKDAPFNATLAKGGLKSGRVEAGRVQLEGWAMELPSHQMADAIAISFQPEGGVECWFGLAQRRHVKAKLHEKLHARAFEQRIGWEYAMPTGNEKVAYSNLPNPFHIRPLPSGKVTFRAYACDLDTGSFTPLEGAFSALMP